MALLNIESPLGVAIGAVSDHGPHRDTAAGVELDPLINGWALDSARYETDAEVRLAMRAAKRFRGFLVDPRKGDGLTAIQAALRKFQRLVVIRIVGGSR